MVGRAERALQVYRDHRVPLGLGHVGQHPVTQDPGVVHHDVQVAEDIDGLLDQLRPPSQVAMFSVLATASPPAALISSTTA